jgi:hypothetical protein
MSPPENAEGRGRGGLQGQQREWDYRRNHNILQALAAWLLAVLLAALLLWGT